MPETALITGASRGIGAATALALARAGCDLLLTARSEPDLRATADGIIAETGRNVRIVAADLSTPEGAHAITLAAAALPALHVLVNNAGATPRGSLAEMPDHAWDDGFALKFRGAVRLTRALWPALIATQGAVVNIAGTAGRTPTADFVIGSAVNAALLAFTKAMADQGGRDGVRVNAINPGFINTGRLRRWTAGLPGTPEEAEAALAKSWGVARIGQPSEIAAMVVFLTVGGGSYCQGGIYDVDGGRTKTL